MVYLFLIKILSFTLINYVKLSTHEKHGLLGQLEAAKQDGGVRGLKGDSCHERRGWGWVGARRWPYTVQGPSYI